MLNGLRLSASPRTIAAAHLGGWRSTPSLASSCGIPPHLHRCVRATPGSRPFSHTATSCVKSGSASLDGAAPPSEAGSADDDDDEDVEIYEVVKRLPSSMLQQFRSQTKQLLRARFVDERSHVESSGPRTTMGMVEAEGVARSLYRWAKRQTMDYEFYQSCLGFGPTSTIGFYPWFTLQSLHLWMYLVRLRGEENRRVAVELEQQLVDILQRDTEEMMLRMGVKWDLQKHVHHCAHSLTGAFMAYDESLLTPDDPSVDPDVVLFDALHRNVWHHDEQDAPSAPSIAALMRYVHKEMTRLDQLDSPTLMAGLYNWGAPPDESLSVAKAEPVISVLGPEDANVFYPSLSK